MNNYAIMLKILKTMTREQLYALFEDLEDYEVTEKIALVSSEWLDRYEEKEEEPDFVEAELIYEDNKQRLL